MNKTLKKIIENMPKDVLINSFETVYEDSIKKDLEIERLNNIIDKGIEAINVYQNEKTLSVGYENLKRIRGILRGNEFDLKMYEEYLEILDKVGSDENE